MCTVTVPELAQHRNDHVGHGLTAEQRRNIPNCNTKDKDRLISRTGFLSCAI